MIAQTASARALLLGLALSLGCGSSGGAAGDTTPAGRRAARQQQKEQEQRKVADYEDENSVGMPDERVSRWRWKGERKACYFLVGNECFSDEDRACKAARCGGRECLVDDASPAHVACAEAPGPRKKTTKTTKKKKKN